MKADHLIRVIFPIHPSSLISLRMGFVVALSLIFTSDAVSEHHSEQGATLGCLIIKGLAPFENPVFWCETNQDAGELRCFDFHKGQAQEFDRYPQESVLTRHMPGTGRCDWPLDGTGEAIAPILRGED